MSLSTMVLSKDIHVLLSYVFFVFAIKRDLDTWKQVLSIGLTFPWLVACAESL